MGWAWKVGNLWADGVGPLAALRSGTFGKWFKAKEEAGAPEEGPGSAHQKNLTILYGLCAYMVHVAQADSFFDERERSLIKQICLELNTELETGLAVQDLNNLIDMAINSKRAIPKILEQARADLKLRYALLRYAWRVAARDGKITEEEFQKIVNLGSEMKAGGQEMLAASSPYYRPRGDVAVRRAALETLDLKEEATSQEIEERYNELSQKFHPANYGNVSDDIRALICEKFTVITKAHAELLKGQKGDVYYGKCPNEKKTVTVGKGELIECFFCHAIWRLPQKEFNPEQIRCGECQALLFFEADLADLFIH